MAMYPNSKASQVLRVLRDDPARTGEVAAELGWSVHITCAHLTNLHLRGRVVRQPFPTGNGLRRFLWSIPQPDKTRERPRVEER